MRPRAIGIVGPTATGKSGLAMRLAADLGLPIIACDSVQVYRFLDIGSAKPNAEDRGKVRHELIDVVDPDQEFSAGDYARLARAQLARGPAIICGGTGFYLRAALWSFGPETERDVTQDGEERAPFEARWMAVEGERPGAIHVELSRVDPETAGRIHPNNVVKALRALWLCACVGGPISSRRSSGMAIQHADILMVNVDCGVEAVDLAIDARCDAMIAAGWVDEVEMLRRRGYDAASKAMRTLGYRQLREALDEGSSLDAAVATIKRETRRYARRQRTFFRHQFRQLAEDRFVNITSTQEFSSEHAAAFLQRDDL